MHVYGAKEARPCLVYILDGKILILETDDSDSLSIAPLLSC